MKSDSQAFRVYTEIRRKILSSQLEPGTRLKEDYWSGKLSVSRMAVREALTRLLGEHLVVLGEKGGYFVKSMSIEDIHAIRELREILELGAVGLAVDRISKKEVQELESICNDFTSMVKQGYFGGACEADIRFHEKLISCSGNQKLSAVYQMSHIPLFHQKLGKTKAFMEDYALTDKEHRTIVKALKQRDRPLAEKTLRQHFQRGEAAVLEFE